MESYPKQFVTILLKQFIWNGDAMFVWGHIIYKYIYIDTDIYVKGEI